MRGLIHITPLGKTIFKTTQKCRHKNTEQKISPFLRTCILGDILRHELFWFASFWMVVSCCNLLQRHSKRLKHTIRS